MKWTRIALVVLVAAALGCSTLEVAVKSQAGTDFTKYRTFSLDQVEAVDDTIAVDLFGTAVANALQARGLSRVPKGGDLLASARFTAEAPPQERNGMIGPPTLESGKGIVTVELVDGKANTTVWSAAAHEELARGATREERQAVAEQVVQKVLEKFPQRTKG